MATPTDSSGCGPARTRIRDEPASQARRERLEALRGQVVCKACGGDSLTGIQYHHNFSRSADKKTIDPLAIEREYSRESAKMSFLARRWFEAIQKETILFVSHDTPSVQQAMELYQVLAEQMPDRATSLLFARARLEPPADSAREWRLAGSISYSMAPSA